MAYDRCKSYQSASSCGWGSRWKSGHVQNKRGLNTPIHLAVDANGIPVRILITEGTRADCKEAVHLIEGISAEVLLADWGYDTNDILSYAVSAGWEICQTVEKNAGRIEKRICRKIKDISWLKEHKWPGLQSIFSIERIVAVRGHCSRETSYYISSRDACAKQLMELAREHWKIESMHWILDVTFSEDDCRFLSENAHKSMNALRKFALAVHKIFLAAHHKKSSIKASMLSTLLDSNLLHFL